MSQNVILENKDLQNLKSLRADSQATTNIKNTSKFADREFSGNSGKNLLLLNHSLVHKNVVFSVSDPTATTQHSLQALRGYTPPPTSPLVIGCGNSHCKYLY